MLKSAQSCASIIQVTSDLKSTMKYPLFAPMEDEYPIALEERHEYILEKLVALWEEPEIDDYFTSLLIDTRGGRQGFSAEAFQDIHRLYKFKETERLRLVEEKVSAIRALELHGINFNPGAFARVVEQGDAALVDLFIRAGMNVNGADANGNNLLLVSLRSGFTIIANMLLKAGAHVDVRDNTGFTPLLMACGKKTQGYKEVAAHLILHGADVNVRDPLGWTPLLLAISAGNKELIELLLKNGAHIAVRTRKGENAMDLARKFGHDELIDLLFEVSADGAIKSRSQFTAQTK